MANLTPSTCPLSLRFVASTFYARQNQGCWGINSYGMFGDGTHNDSLVPVMVTMAIEARVQHVAGLALGQAAGTVAAAAARARKRAYDEPQGHRPSDTSSRHRRRYLVFHWRGRKSFPTLIKWTREDSRIAAHRNVRATTHANGLRVESSSNREKSRSRVSNASTP